MSSPSIGQPRAGHGGGKSPAALGLGVLLLAVALLGWLAPVIGLPFGLHPALIAPLLVCAAGFIILPLVRVKSGQDFMGGIFLLALASVAVFGTLKLNFQTSTGVGPGMMPRAVGGLVGLCGLVLCIQSFFSRGEGLDRWSVRGIIFVLGAALMFAWTIRPLGLLVAGPLAVIFAAYADRDTRIIEVLAFAIGMTLFCIGLFSYALRLPIPITPTAIPYPINVILH